MASNQPPSKKPKYVEDIQKLLECPVCLQNPKYPDKVHFCSNGHMICDGCHAQIQTCPVCRTRDLRGQNPLVKQVLSRLPRLCPYSDQGCDVESDGSDMETHVKNCRFRLIDCTSKRCDSKEHRVPFHSFIKHQIDQHKANQSQALEGSNLTCTLVLRNLERKKQSQSLHGWPPTVWNYDGHTFIAKTYSKDGNLLMQFLLHGKKAEAEKYIYEIKMKNSATPMYNLGFSGDVIPTDLQFPDRMDHSGTFVLSYSAVRNFLEHVDENRQRLILYFAVRTKSSYDSDQNDEITTDGPEKEIECNSQNNRVSDISALIRECLF